MIKFTFKIDAEPAYRKIAAIREQIPFAAALALTKTAQAVKADLVSGMSSAFAHPTAYTLNSLYLDRATKTSLVATIGVKGADSGTGAARWLKPEIYGGARQHAIEAVLQAINLPPPGLWAVPGSRAKLTSGGKLDITWLRSLVADIGSQGGSGIVSKRLKGIRKSNGALKYFVLPAKKGRLAPGIYAKQGFALLPLIIFVRQPKYGAKFDFYGIAKRTAQQAFPIEFAKAVKRALATAR